MVLIQLLTSLTVIVVGEWHANPYAGLLQLEGQAFLAYWFCLTPWGFGVYFELLLLNHDVGYSSLGECLQYIGLLLIISEFIWLLNIETQTTYHSNFLPTTIQGGVDEFNLLLRQPTKLPHGRLELSLQFCSSSGNPSNHILSQPRCGLSSILFAQHKPIHGRWDIVHQPTERGTQ
jgi:hypothetical protein